MSDNNLTTTPEELEKMAAGKKTFGQQKKKKEGASRKKVATTVVAAVMAAAAIAVPTVIKVNQNRGFTITIDYGEAGGIETINVKRGAKLSSINTPKKAGYYFAGFYSDSAFGNRLDESTEITESSTVYLCYIPIRYSFADIPTGVNIKLSDSDVDPNMALYYESEPLLISYRVDAGYHIENFSVSGLELVERLEPVEEDGATIHSAKYKIVGYGLDDEKETELKVEYEQKINVYQVRFKDDNGGIYEDYSLSVSHGDFVAMLSEPTKESDVEWDYTFSHWVDEKGNYVDLNTFKVERDVDLTAVFNKSKRVYTFNITKFPETAPSVITVTRYNEDGTSEEVLTDLHYGELITITFKESEGYTSTQFELNDEGEDKGLEFTGKYTANNEKIYRVLGNVQITYYESISELDIVYGNGVTVEAYVDGLWTVVDSGSKLDYGTKVRVNYTLTEGHSLVEFKNSVNGKDLTADLAFDLKEGLQVSFVETINLYTLTFMNEGKAFAVKVNVKHGSSVGVDMPTKDADLAYRYEFAGWFDADGNALVSDNVTKSETYYARYNPIAIDYSLTVNVAEEFASNIKIRNSKNELLTADSVLHYEDLITISCTPFEQNNAKPLEYSGLELVDAETGTYKVVGNVSVSYDEQIKVFNVTFVNWDGTEIAVQPVEWGKAADLAVVDAERPADPKYTYVFDKWVTTQGGSTEAVLSGIKANKTVYASYESVYNEYGLAISTSIGGSDGYLTVKNLTQDKNLRRATTVHYEDELEITYKSSTGWHMSMFDVLGLKDQELVEMDDGSVVLRGVVAVSGDESVSVNYAEEINEYRLNFGNYISVKQKVGSNWTDLSSGAMVQYGSVLQIVYEHEGYTASNISVNGTEIGADGRFVVEETNEGTVLEVSYEESLNSYTVSFYNYDGSLLNSADILWGGDATSSAENFAPADWSDAVYNYYFAGWVSEKGGETLASFTDIKADLSVWASYSYEAIEFAISDFASENVSIVFVEANSEIESSYKPGAVLHAGNTLHAGDKVRISYTVDEGYDLSSFRVDGALESEENGVFVVAEDLAVNFAQTVKEYQLTLSGLGGEIRVTDQDGVEYNNGDSVEHFKVLTITYRASTGKHITKLAINGQAETLGSDVNNNKIVTATHNVSGAISIEYAEADNVYTVVFYDEDGETVLYTTDVVHGNEVVYGKADPTKADDLKFSYEFAGWLENGAEAEFGAVESNKNYVANYDRTAINYVLEEIPAGVKVTFVNASDDTIGNYSEGEQLSVGASLHYEDEIKVEYTLDEGYHKEVFAVNGKAVNSGDIVKFTNDFSIEFTQAVNTYALNLRGNGGTVVVTDAQNKVYNNGDLVEFGKALTVNYTADAGYHITGLEVNGTRATLDGNANSNVNAVVNFTIDSDIADITVNYSQTVNSYLLEFENNGGQITVTDAEGNSYLNGTEVNHFTVLTVTYKASTGYHVTKLNTNGSLAELDSVANNNGVVTFNYTVGGTVTIEGQQAINTYSVVFYNESREEVLFSTTVDYGSSVIYDADEPSKVDEKGEYTYYFYGWVDEAGKPVSFDAVTSDIEVFANYSSEVNEYTIGYLPNGVVVEFVEANANIKSSHKAGATLLAGNTLHAGDKVRISYTVDEGYELDLFRVDGAVESEESGVFVVAQELLINFVQVAKEYELTLTGVGGEITVTDQDGVEYKTGDKVEHFKVLTITYKASTGHHVTKLAVNGKLATLNADANNNAVISAEHTVTGAISVEFAEAINEYTVVFYDEDKTTVLFSDTLTYGSEIVFDADEPTKAADNTFTYAFAGWLDENGADASFGEIINNKVYVASYIATAIEYSLNVPEGVTVTFVSASEAVESEYTAGVTTLTSANTLHYGDKIKVEYSLTEGYHLNQFTVNGESVENGAEITVNDEMVIAFKEEINTYAVVYGDNVVITDAKGNVIESGAVINYGTEIKLTYTSSTGYHKTAFELVNGGLNITEQKTEGEATGYITGKVVGEINVKYEEAINEYTINIVGNGGAVTVVDNDGKSYANGDKITHFTEILVKYTVGEGYHIKNLMINGSVASLGEDVNANTSVTMLYVAEGEVNVVYEQEVNSYELSIIGNGGTVTVTDAEGNEYFDGDSVEHFKTLTVTYQADEGYHVTSLVANDKVASLGAEDVRDNSTATVNVNVTGAVDVTYMQAVNKYTVVFYDEDSTTVLYQTTLDWGSEIVYAGEQPSKQSDQVYDYEFAAWTTENGNVASFEAIATDKVYVASYSATAIEYAITIPEGVTVTFVGGAEGLTSSHTAGDVLTSEDTIHYGDQVKVEYTLTEGYHLKEFTVNGNSFVNGDGLVCEGELVITFAEEINTYSVVFYDEDGTTVLYQTTLDYGSDIAYGGEEPTKAANKTFTYDFAGWLTEEGSEADFSAIKEKKVYVANYSATAIEYTIGEIPAGVTVIWVEANPNVASGYADETELTSEDTIHYGDKIKVEYAVTENDFVMKSFLVNGISNDETNTSSSEYGYVVGLVEDNLTITFTEDHAYLTFTGSAETGYTVSGLLNTEREEDVVIPATYKGGAVVAIGENAFRNTYFSNISLPNSIKIIGNSAFYKSKLTSITIPDSVTSLGVSVFQESGNLSSVIIGKGLTTIPGLAFESCEALTNVIIPDNIKSIEIRAFAFCYNLEEITIGSGVTNIYTSEIKNSFTSCTKLKTVTIHSKSIYNALTSADACGGLIANAETIKVLGERSLNSLGQTVDNGSNAYLNSVCTKTADEAMRYNIYTNMANETFSISYIASGLNVVMQTKNVHIPSTITNGSAITTSSVLHYGDILKASYTAGPGLCLNSFGTNGLAYDTNSGFTAGATSGEIQLRVVGSNPGESLGIGYSLKAIQYKAKGSGSTAYPSGISVSYVSNGSVRTSYVGNSISSGTAVSANSTVLYHGDKIRISYNCSTGYKMSNFSVSGISITSSSGTGVGNTSGYIEGTVNQANPVISFTQEKQTYTVTFANYDGTKLDSVNVKYGESATYGGSNPTRSTGTGQDNTWNYTYTYTYKGWSNSTYSSTADATLSSITSNKTVYAAYDKKTDKSYREYTLSTGTGIKVYFIAGPSGSRYNNNEEIVAGMPLRYGDTVKFVSNTADGITTTNFSSASGLTGITTTGLNTHSASLQASVNGNVNVVAVTSWYLSFTKASSYYSVFKLTNSNVTDIRVPSTYEGIRVGSVYTSAFSGQSKIKTVTLPSSVTDIGGSAFERCSNLTSINLSNVTFISSYAFSRCTSLTNVNLSGLTGMLQAYAFYGCTGLTSVNVPVSISNSVFEGCTGLRSLTIGSSVTRIDSRAFYGCTGLVTVTILSQSIWTQIKEETSCGYLIYYADYVQTVSSCDNMSSYFKSSSKWVRDGSIGQYYQYHRYTPPSTSGC